MKTYFFPFSTKIAPTGDRFHDMIVFQKFLFHPSTQLPEFKPMVLQISTLDSVLSHRRVDGDSIFAD